MTLHYDDVRWDLLDGAGTVIDGGPLGAIPVDGGVDLAVHEIEAVGRA